MVEVDMLFLAEKYKEKCHSLDHRCRQIYPGHWSEESRSIDVSNDRQFTQKYRDEQRYHREYVYIVKEAVKYSIHTIWPSAIVYILRVIIVPEA